MPFWEDDLDLFFEEFGVDATFKYENVRIVFDDGYQAVDVQTGEIESSDPQATGKTEKFANAEHGDTLEINDISYKIIGIQPDGTGLTTLILSKD